MTGVFILAALSANADVAAGKRAYDNGDYATAFQEWKASAEQGDPEAQYRLGQMYLDGKGVQRDMLELIRWWTEAAKQGNLKAQAYVGWPISLSDEPYLTCGSRRAPPQAGGVSRFGNLDSIDFEIEFHHTRPFIEQMVLAKASSYTPGYEPKRPNLEVLVYRVEGDQRSLVPVGVSDSGGSSGPYGDEARRGHFRNPGVSNESLYVTLRIPVEDAERRIYARQMLAEMERLVNAGQANPELLQLNRKLLEEGSAANPYFDSILPNRPGRYEIVARYASRDERFWPDQLTSPPLPFEVIQTREWIDVLRNARPRQ